MWKIFQNLWVRGKIKACVVEADHYENLPNMDDGCVLAFGGLTDNPGYDGVPGGVVTAYALKDGWLV
ncbi:MAG: hypothetical protein MUP55_02780 [Candidatus Aenigmarchaeota archaeon]|nr:hypothetical protein [Candidatus Aenigmarchaeota archaeon]